MRAVAENVYEKCEVCQRWMPDWVEPNLDAILDSRISHCPGCWQELDNSVTSSVQFTFRKDRMINFFWLLSNMTKRHEVKWKRNEEDAMISRIRKDRAVWVEKETASEESLRFYIFKLETSENPVELAPRNGNEYEALYKLWAEALRTQSLSEVTVREFKDEIFDLMGPLALWHRRTPVHMLFWDTICYLGERNVDVYPEAEDHDDTVLMTTEELDFFDRAMRFLNKIVIPENEMQELVLEMNRLNLIPLRI